MKKSRSVLLLIPLSFALLTGCSNSKARLTFGTYINQDLNSLEVLDNVELKAKADNNKQEACEFISTLIELSGILEELPQEVKEFIEKCL